MDINYDKNGLVTVVVQEYNTGKVLMVAWADENAVEMTRKTGYAHYFSRSRNKIWKKGEESGHVQEIIKILIDCDCDALLYQVRQTGGACHTGYDSCFYRTLDGEVVGDKIFDPDKVYAN
ncbi:MAG: phosphoribosyl-AMP cyclohydrolase [Methanomicrobium sp.]|nr:phosphoribosyl-AMP cyclohydrolase [Methanomicrobium sp.]